jgi:hypothetical protein
VPRPEGPVRRADAWLFAAADARRLAAVRIGLCCVLALRLATTDYDSVAGGHRMFEPHSYMDVLARMPSVGAANTLQVLGVAAAVAAAAGLVCRITLPLAFASALLLDGMVNSAGRVIVGDALLMLCGLVLIASGGAAAEAWSVRRPLRLPATRPVLGGRYGWPVRTMMVAVALSYFFAGLQKWRYSGPSWVTSDNLRLILYASSDAHAHPNALALFVADRPWLAHALAAGALLLETLFPLILFVSALRLPFIAGAIGMHVGIQFALGLDYAPQWLTLLVVYVDWPATVARLPGVAVRPSRLLEARR